VLVVEIWWAICKFRKKPSCCWNTNWTSGMFKICNIDMMKNVRFHQARSKAYDWEKLFFEVKQIENHGYIDGDTN